MKVSVSNAVGATDNSLTAEIIDCDQALVNALRRVILADIPYVALLHEAYSTDGSQFVFRKNTGVLHNHIMAHRMTMVPMYLSLPESQSYIPGSIRVRLAAENKSKSPLDVTSRDIQVFLHDQPHPDRDRLYPPDPDTKDWPLLTVLKEGESVDIEATAIVGTAARNASFAVVSLCTFSPILDEALVQKGYEAAKASEDAARALNRFEHIDKKRCWIPGPDGGPTSFRFSVTSECGLSAREIVYLGLDVLEKKVLGAKGVFTKKDDGAYAIEVKGDDHTLGNLMQSVALDELDAALKFVGYVCPHPLDKRVVFTVILANNTTPEAAFESMKSATAARIKTLKVAFGAEGGIKDQSNT